MAQLVVLAPPQQPEEMRGPEQIRRDADVDREAAGQRHDREHALCPDVVAGEGFAHERRAEAFLDVRRATAVVGDLVARLEELAVDARRRTESRHSGPAARDVEAALLGLDQAVPDAASVAGIQAALVGMLELQVAGRHELVGQAVPGGGQVAVSLVPFVHDHQAEGIEERAAEIRRHHVRMVAGSSPISRASPKLK